MLREFGEFRYLFYGLAIIAVMRLKPEGLWPSAARLRELEGEAEAVAVQRAPVAEKSLMTGAALLRTEQMTKRFGGLVAVDRLELEVQDGAIHSIIGPNGAGKTTVFNCIMEFYTPDDGQIWFAGQRIDGLTPDRVAAAGINRTYQTIRLFRNLTAIENILVGMHIHLRSTWYGAVLNTRATRDDEARAHADARGILDFVGLRGRGDVVARDLAYGEQRRLEVAPGARHPATPLDAGRADGRHESPRKRRDDELHPPGAR